MPCLDFNVDMRRHKTGSSFTHCVIIENDLYYQWHTWYKFTKCRKMYQLLRQNKLYNEKFKCNESEFKWRHEQEKNDTDFRHYELPAIYDIGNWHICIINLLVMPDIFEVGKHTTSKFNWAVKSKNANWDPCL